MFWKLFKLQQLLDSLFDDSWFSLGLDSKGQDHEAPHAGTSLHQA